MTKDGMSELARQFSLAAVIENATPKIKMLFKSKTGLDTPNENFRSENTTEVYEFFWKEYVLKYFDVKVGLTQDVDDRNLFPCSTVIDR